VVGDDLLGGLDVWHPEAAAWYRERGLSHSTVLRFRLGRVRHGRYAGRLAIPYQDALYRVRAVRYRALRPDQNPKYLSPAGQGVHLFAVRAAESPVVVVTEGEVDAMSVWQVGGRAVGVPGANVWQDEWSLLFSECERVILAFDADTAGDRGKHRVAHSLRKAGVNLEVADLPAGQDINDILRSGDNGAQRVREVLGV